MSARRINRAAMPGASMRTRAVLRIVVCAIALGALVPEAASAQGSAPAASPRATAPVDLTGYWVSVIHEDWAWRMRTPPPGDYASVPLNDAGRRIADRWSVDQDGSCLAFGAAALLRMPTRVHITWADDDTLQIDADNGAQTRLLHFDTGMATPVTRTLQGHSVAQWVTAPNVLGSRDPDRGAAQWATLEVVTTQMLPAWLRPNGVPYSENAVLTQYFDSFADGDDAWFTVTTIVDDPTYLTEPFVVSSNFKREQDAGKWNPEPCRQ